MFGFATKKKKRANKNKNNNGSDKKQLRVRIEEMDTPADTPTPTTPQTPLPRSPALRPVSQRTPTPYPRRSTSASKSAARATRKKNNFFSFGSSPTPTPTPTPTLTLTPTSAPTKIKSEGEMILFFIEMLNTVKLYHWKTRSFATHKATDELYEDLNKYVDEFVEVMLGYKGGVRANIPRTSVKMNDFSTPEQFGRKLNEFKNTLISYTHKLDPKRNSDLLNIRDELLATLNKTTYLLSFH